jgi:hypothetical protein
MASFWTVGVFCFYTFLAKITVWLQFCLFFTVGFRSYFLDLGSSIRAGTVQAISIVIMAEIQLARRKQSALG